MKQISLSSSIFYQQNSDIQKEIASKIILNFEKTANNLINTSKAKTKQIIFKILEIGAGSGNLTIKMIDSCRAIIEKHLDIEVYFELTISEPNSYFLNTLKQNTQQQATGKGSFRRYLNRISFFFEQKSAEHFFNTEYMGRFDFAVSTFVYHWVGDFFTIFDNFHGIARNHIFTIPTNRSFTEINNALKNNNINLSIDNFLPQEQSILRLLDGIINKQYNGKNTTKVDLKYCAARNSAGLQFDRIFDIFVFFKKSGYNNIQTKGENYTQANLTKNLCELKKVKALNISCKMEFAYLDILLKKA
jgi:SAM-dependent methyltransferase